jgi:hypothetical protein
LIELGYSATNKRETLGKAIAKEFYYNGSNENFKMGKSDIVNEYKERIIPPSLFLLK